MTPVPEMLAPLVGGVLVGGASRRFGSPKALARLEGRTLLERVVDALRPVVREVYLLGRGPETALGPVPVHGRLEDAPGAAGPLAGIVAALRHLPGAAWLIAGCDQGLLTREACSWLVAQRKPGFLAVLPRRSSQRVEPFPAIYEPGIAGELERLLAQACFSLQPLASSPGVSTPSIPESLQPAWSSFDRPEQLLEVALDPGRETP